MRAIIIGGGKVGYYLLKTLKDEGYEITLIEKDASICNKIAEKFDVDIICGDGTDIEVLKDAGIEYSEIVAAVTGKDEENFTICQIIKINFNHCKTIARINNPKNSSIFKALGIDKTVCSTEVIANLIESELNDDKIKIIQALDRGEMVLLELNIDKKSSWRNKTISNINAPNGCIIVSIFRDKKIIYPNGSIEIKEGDKVFIVTNMERKYELEKCI